MADEIVVSTPAGTVEVPTESTVETDEEFEVSREWVESLFANVSAALVPMGQAVTLMVDQHNKMLEMLSSLHSRLPDNLMQMISNQEQTITSLIAQGQETTREILRSLTQPPPQPTVTEPQENVVAVQEVPATPPAEAPRKRRMI